MEKASASSAALVASELGCSSGLASSAPSPVEDGAAFDGNDALMAPDNGAIGVPEAAPSASSSSASPPVISWLAKHCFAIVNPEERIGTGESKVSPLRIEALQLLGYMVRSHIQVLQADLETLVGIIKAGLQDEESSVQLHRLVCFCYFLSDLSFRFSYFYLQFFALFTLNSIPFSSAKLLEELGRSLLAELECTTSNNPSSSSMPRRVSLAEVKGIWISVLGDASLVAALQNMNEPLIQAAACDALATIGSQVLQMLPMDKVILSMTIPLGLAQPEIDPLVRASAIRALGKEREGNGNLSDYFAPIAAWQRANNPTASTPLLPFIFFGFAGIFIQYPTLREDVNFISDVGQAVISCLDPATTSTSLGQQVVRIKAAWAFGNLSESL